MEPQQNKAADIQERDPAIQTGPEEFINGLTHFIGFGLSVSALVLLVVFGVKAGDPWRIVSFAIFGSALVLLYLSSTIYHWVTHDRIKRVLFFFDHCSIFLLIAGTYTPFTLVTIRGGWGWSIFGVIWGLALLGILFKIIVGYRYEIVTTTLYAVMGWLIVIAFKPITNGLSVPALLLLLAGGLSYTFGIAFFMWEKLPFNHGIWHLFVMGGSTCHFFCIILYVAPVA